MLGSDRCQLANSANGPAPAFAQDRASSPNMADVWFAMKAGATLAAITDGNHRAGASASHRFHTDACARVGGERSFGCAFGWTGGSPSRRELESAESRAMER